MAHVHHHHEAPFGPSSIRTDETPSRRSRSSRRAPSRNQPLSIAIAIGVTLIAAVIAAYALGSGDEGDRRLDSPVLDPEVPVRPGQPAR